MIKSTIVLILVLAWTGLSWQECTKAQLARYEDLMTQLSPFGNPKAKFPEDLDQLKQWCSNTADIVPQIHKLNNQCNKAMAKLAVEDFLGSSQAFAKSHCSANSAAGTRFVVAARCFNTIKQQELRVYATLMDELVGAKNAPDAKKLPHFCCILKRSNEKLAKGMRAKCDKDKAKVMLDVFQSMSNNPMCGQYMNDPNKCSQLGLPPKKKKSQRRAKSLSMQVVDLISSIRSFNGVA